MEVLRSLQPFVDALRMTRDPKMYPKWGAGTVDKAFVWADRVANLSDEKRRLMSKGLSELEEGSQSSLSFLTDTGRGGEWLLQHPSEALLWSILSSPLLTWVAKARQVVVQAIESSSARNRLGRDRTTIVVCDTMQANMQVRLKVATHTDCQDTYLSVENVSLAVLLLSQMSLETQQSTTSHVTVIRNFATQDIASLRILCIALTLTPSRIACAAKQHPLSWEQIYRESNNVALWGVVNDSLLSNPAQFLNLDNSFSLCQELAKRNELFGKNYLAALAFLSTTHECSPDQRRLLQLALAQLADATVASAHLPRA